MEDNNMQRELIGEQKGSIVLYTTPEGNTQLEVKLENDTVWLSQQQMSMLFGVEENNITYHIQKILKSGELLKEATTQKIRVVRVEGTRQVARPIVFYNLDMIISVGYRVNSRNATQFRIWATSILKQYIIKGYAIDQRRLDNYNELKDVVRLMSRAVSLQEKVSGDEYNGLFSVISDYVYALDTLDHYDYQDLTIAKTTTKEEPFHATYENAMEAINALRSKFGGSALFAHEKDESFHSSIGQIYQTFDGQDLYPSIEEKAAMLFLWFLSNNGILYAEDGHKRIADNTLVALTLMIAESRPDEKDVMVKVVVNLINQENQ